MIVLAFALTLCVSTVGATDYQYAQVSTQKGPLNMRESASTKASKVDEIPNGTIITITSKGDTWCTCIYNGLAGYVMTKYLTFMELSQFRTLSQNDSGEDVLAVKEKLQALYYFDADVKITDLYDAEAVTAIKAFQAANGMDETGVVSPELQALLFWGSAKNNLPTQKMAVTIARSCSSYNHVGNSWSKYSSINSNKISSGDLVELVLGESITLYSKITESDSTPDVGSVKEDIEITQAFFDNGFTITHKVAVQENRGRYSGNNAYWTVTYTFTPQGE